MGPRQPGVCLQSFPVLLVATPMAESTRREFCREGQCNLVVFRLWSIAFPASGWPGSFGNENCRSLRVYVRTCPVSRWGNTWDIKWPKRCFEQSSWRRVLYHLHIRQRESLRHWCCVASSHRTTTTCYWRLRETRPSQTKSSSSRRWSVGIKTGRCEPHGQMGGGLCGMLHPASSSWRLHHSFGAQMTRGVPWCVGTQVQQVLEENSSGNKGITVVICLNPGQNRTFCPCSVPSSGDVVFAMTAQQ